MSEAKSLQHWCRTLPSFNSQMRTAFYLDIQEWRREASSRPQYVILSDVVYKLQRVAKTVKILDDDKAS